MADTSRANMTILASIGRRRVAAERYIDRLHATSPTLPLNIRRALAARLVPEDHPETTSR